MSYNLNNAPLRIPVTTSIIRNFNNYLMPCNCSPSTSFWNINVFSKFLVICDYKTKVFTFRISTYNYTIASFYNFSYSAFTFPAIPFFFNSNPYRITINCTFRVSPRNINVFFLTLNPDKAKVPLCPHILSSFNIIRHKLNPAFGVNLEFSFARKFLNHFPQIFFLFRRNL